METTREYAQRVADALVDVVEAARWDARIASLRDLAARAGMTHTALNKRMRGETPFNVRDLAAIAAVLNLHPAELIKRAKDAVDGNVGTISTLPARKPPSPATQKRAARKQSGKPKLEDE